MGEEAPFERDEASPQEPLSPESDSIQKVTHLGMPCPVVDFSEQSAEAVMLRPLTCRHWTVVHVSDTCACSALAGPSYSTTAANSTAPRAARVLRFWYGTCLPHLMDITYIAVPQKQALYIHCRQTAG